MGFTLSQLKEIFNRPFWREVIRSENPGYITQAAREKYEGQLTAALTQIIPATTHGIPAPIDAIIRNANGRDVETLITIDPVSKEVIIQSNCPLTNHSIVIF